MLLTTIVLARLLTPTDFGVVAFAIVAIDLLTIGKDVGMGAALIEHQDESSAAFDTAFTLNLLMACVLTVVCLALAPQITTSIDEPAVGPLLRWMSLTFLLDAGGFVHLVHSAPHARVPPQAQLRRHSHDCQGDRLRHGGAGRARGRCSGGW